MKDVVERSREIIETTIDRMEESCDPDIKYGIKGEKITGAMLPYITTIEDTKSDITPQQICDYIDLLYENDREYNLHMLKKKLKTLICSGKHMYLKLQHIYLNSRNWMTIKNTQ